MVGRVRRGREEGRMEGRERRDGEGREGGTGEGGGREMS